MVILRESQSPSTTRFRLFEGIDSSGVLWLALMSGMIFVLLLPINSYVAAVPFVQEEWSLNNTEAGVVFSASLIGYAFAALFLLPLTDRLGPRVVLLGSAVLSAAAQIAFPLVADGLPSSIALRAAAGIGFLGVYVPGLRIIAERFPRGGRGTAMGLFVTAQYAAQSASLAITGGLMSFLEWRDAYLVMALAALTGLPLIYALLRGKDLTAPGVGSSALDLTVLRDSMVRYLILGYSVHAFVVFAVRVWLPLFLTAALIAGGEDVATAAVTGATVAGLALMLGALGPVTGGLISDRFGRAASASAILGVSAACSLAIGWMADMPWALIVALAVLYGWATAADSAIYQTGVAEAAGPGKLGSTLAVQAFIGLLGGVAGPVVMGGILDLTTESLKWGVGFSSLGLLAFVAITGLQRARYLPETRLLSSRRD